MNKKGFTLIELLAVIVILAIIALIAVPIVLGIIEDARKSATLRSAEFYLDGVEQSVARAMLNGVAIDSDKQYQIMKSGDICLGNYVETDQDGKESCKYEDGDDATLKVEVDGQKPTGGAITLSSGSISEATLNLNNKDIELKDGKLVYVEEKELIPTVASCFEYIDNYDYTINKEICLAGYGSAIEEGLGEGSSEAICSGDETQVSIFSLANLNGISIDTLIQSGVISIEPGSENGNGTITITGYKCGGENGTAKDVVIPSSIDNKTVTKIGVNAFYPGNFSDGSAIETKLINSIVIPDTITRIEHSAFYNNSLTKAILGNNIISIAKSAFRENNLKTIIIPDNVVTIGKSAFSYCENLESAIIGKNVTTIGESAFYGNNLKSIIIPDNVTTIEKSAFSHCENLESATIGKNVTTIGESAFSYCENLESAIIGKNVTTIGESAFYRNNLKSIIIPDNVTTIEKSAFQHNELESITIGKNVTTIGEVAFVDNKLTSIVIPDSVESIGKAAFRSNQITTVVIGSGITSIGDYAFADGCWNACHLGQNDIEDVYINKSSSDVTLGESVFNWAEGYNANDNLHWNSTGPTE